jgi:hypothetical protein
MNDTAIYFFYHLDKDELYIIIAFELLTTWFDKLALRNIKLLLILIIVSIINLFWQT